MKRLFLIIAIVALVFSSCSNKVDLYSEEGDTTIVYALLDANADTNFFKITKSFIGNATELGQVYEANNYKYDEIDVKFIGIFEGNNKIDTVALDTVSKYIAPSNSTFYNDCYQTYYYTTKKLKEGQEYELRILIKADNTTVSVKSETINSFSFKKPTAIQYMAFKDIVKQTVEWKGDDASMFFQSTAAYFEVNAYFNFWERQPGQGITHKSIKWALGANTAENLYTTSNNTAYYSMTYSPMSLFGLLENDEYLNNNSPAGVHRWFDKFEIRITAIGDVLYNYYLITNSTSAIQDVPNYTNVENGMGIMSSRVTKSRQNEIHPLSKNKIIEDFPRYNFKDGEPY